MALGSQRHGALQACCVLGSLGLIVIYSAPADVNASLSSGQNESGQRYPVQALVTFVMGQARVMGV